MDAAVHEFHEITFPDGTGQINVNFQATLFNLGLSLPVFFLLLPHWGIMGAIWNKMISGAIGYFITLLFFWKYRPEKTHK